MREQTLKELGIELKKLQLKEDDVLVIELNLDKIKPQMAANFIEMISNSVDNKIILYPKEMNVERYGVKDIIRIKNKFNEEVDKILKGEE